VRLMVTLRARLFKGKPAPWISVRHRDDLYSRTNCFMEFLNIDCNKGDERELRRRLEIILELYMKQDNCPDIKPQAGLW
jgi:hypothetical protein